MCVCVCVCVYVSDEEASCVAVFVVFVPLVMEHPVVSCVMRGDLGYYSTLLKSLQPCWLGSGMGVEQKGFSLTPVYRECS